jgi:hypothetical protein
MEGKTMAKDKGAKAPKSKGNDDFAKPSDAPATGGDGFNFENVENVGKLFIITPLREDEVETKKYGTAEVIVADIVEVNEKKPEKSVEHTNVYVFGGWTKGALRGYVGERKVLGRLGQDAAKSKSDKPAWVLEDADDDDVRIARAYLETVDPFAQKGAAKPAKKSKK